MGNILYADKQAAQSTESLLELLGQLKDGCEREICESTRKNLENCLSVFLKAYEILTDKSSAEQLSYGLLQLQVTSIVGEVQTPLLQAIQLALDTKESPDQIKKAGHGFLIQGSEEKQICQLECNIDDCTGEMLGLAMERLFQAGARDVRFAPVFMKKNRPAYELKVICTVDRAEEMEALIFKNTTTIGIRRQFLERSVLERRSYEAETSMGRVQVKECVYPDGVRIYPEYESVRKICQEKDMPYDEAYVRIRGELFGNKRS